VLLFAWVVHEFRSSEARSDDALDETRRERRKEIARSASFEMSKEKGETIELTRPAISRPSIAA